MASKKKPEPPEQTVPTEAELEEADAEERHHLYLEAQRLSDERVMRDLGVYGKVKATEREIRLAQLEAHTTHRPYPLTYLSRATGLSVTDIVALRAGSGANPNYRLIANYYAMNELRPDLAEGLRALKEHIDNLPPDERYQPYREWVKLAEQFVHTQIKPPKLKQLDFQDRDKTPARELARRAVAEMLLTEPPMDGRDGGPGPLR